MVIDETIRQEFDASELSFHPGNPGDALDFDRYCDIYGIDADALHAEVRATLELRTAEEYAQETGLASKNRTFSRRAPIRGARGRDAHFGISGTQ